MVIDMANKNDWVLVHRNVLEPSGRAAAVPDDTKSVPLEMWVKGRLIEPAEIGAPARVITVTGREEHGALLEVNPNYTHSFGDFVPELLQIGEQLREMMFGGDSHE